LLCDNSSRNRWTFYATGETLPDKRAGEGRPLVL